MFLIYSSSSRTQKVAAIAGAKISPINPRYCAVTSRKKYIISGCKSNNFPQTYGLTKLFSIHCANRKKNTTNPITKGP